MKPEPMKVIPPGYYFEGSWRPLGGVTMYQFNESSAITQCLMGKVINMYGDSTVRQWFEYLNAFVPGEHYLNESFLHCSLMLGRGNSTQMFCSSINIVACGHFRHSLPVTSIIIETAGFLFLKSCNTKMKAIVLLIVKI